MKTLKKITTLLLALVLISVTSCGTKGNKELKKVEGFQISRMEVSISGMTCTGCEQTIQTNVAKIEGVMSVKATFTTGKAVVDFNPAQADTSKIRTAITGSGYKVTGFTPVEITQ
jgi:copper chaperone CopZ